MESVGVKNNMRNLLIASSVGSFITPFTSTMLNLSLMAIGSEFGTSSHDLGYVNTVFLLSSVMMMVPLTKVTEKYGPKKVFISGLILMTVSSILSLLSPSFGLFILARIIMGIASAAVSITGIVMIVDSVDSKHRGKAIGINTTAVYLGMALGPTVGGFITDILGWRFLFLILLPIAVISLAIMKNVNVPCTYGKERFDFAGAVMFMTMIAFLMYGIITLPGTRAIAFIAVGSVITVVFLKYVLQKTNPILNVKIYRNRSFSYPLAATFLNYGASYSISFFLALYLQNIGALTATEAGLIMLVQPLIQVLLTAKIGSLSDRLDSRILTTAGMILISAAVIMILFLDMEISIPYVVFIMTVIGLGFSLFSAPNSSAIMSSVSPAERGTASGNLSMMRQAGMMVSMGIGMCCISVFMGSTAVMEPSTFGNFMTAMKIAFTFCLMMCIVGIYLSWKTGKKTYS